MVRARKSRQAAKKKTAEVEAAFQLDEISGSDVSIHSSEEDSYVSDDYEDDDDIDVDDDDDDVEMVRIILLYYRDKIFWNHQFLILLLLLKDQDEVDHAKTIRNAKKAKKDIRGVKKGVAKKGKVAKKKPAEAKKKSLRSKKVNNRNTEESSSNDIKTKTARALEDPSSSNVLNMQSSQLKEDQVRCHNLFAACSYVKKFFISCLVVIYKIMD